jgi:UDP-glucuronate decarboxylase
VICQALSGNPITIYGDGSQTRSFCYVADTVDGLRRLMEAEFGALEPINIGNPRELTVRELVDLVLAELGRPAAVIYRPLPEDDLRRRRPNIERARTLLGWEPKTALEDGIRATTEWFARELREPTENDLAIVASIGSLDKLRPSYAGTARPEVHIAASAG